MRTAAALSPARARPNRAPATPPRLPAGLFDGIWRGSIPSKLENLVDGVGGTVRLAIAAGDGEKTVQEVVPWGARLEPQRRSKVVPCRVDLLAATESGDHLRGTMAEAERRHLDQGTVVGLQRDAQVELEHTICSQQGPISASRQDLPAQPRSFELAADDGHGDPRTVGNGADLLRRPHGHLKSHEQRRFHM